jgi:tripartite-type tricarboxylate transporter receptor subunit TctC
VRAVRAALALLAALAFAPHAAKAQDFYRGRTVTLYVGFGVGGTYDLYARAVAQHLGRHIPGSPTVVVVNMPGAGGIAAANYMYRVAPKDGTALALTAQSVATDQLFGVEGIQYDVRRFIWVGRITPVETVFFTWHTSPTKTFADAQKRETTMGSSGSGDTVDPPRALNQYAGSHFKLVQGYRGSNDVALAVERGEVDGGYAAWADLAYRNHDWIEQKQVNLLFFMADRHPKLAPDVPLGTELAPTDEGKAIMGLFTAPNVIGRSILTTPDVPAARVAILRQAFAATLDDAAFQADAQKIGLVPEGMSGDELGSRVAALMATPADLVKKAEAIRQPAP